MSKANHPMDIDFKKAIKTYNKNPSSTLFLERQKHNQFSTVLLLVPLKIKYSMRKHLNRKNSQYKDKKEKDLLAAINIKLKRVLRLCLTKSMMIRMDSWSKNSTHFLTEMSTSVLGGVK